MESLIVASTRCCREIGRAPSELQSRRDLVCRLLLEKKKEINNPHLKANDRITGGAGSDTIQLVDTGSVTVALAAFTNLHRVETLNIFVSGTDSVTIGALALPDVLPI